jgi:hypothetical protein
MRRKAGSTGVITRKFPSVVMALSDKLRLKQPIYLPATTSSSINQERGSNGATACTSTMALLIKVDDNVLGVSDGRNRVGTP